ncbi:MAG: type VI secretion system accessory protein TagJ [Steroidobacteraceae bacterium]
MGATSAEQAVRDADLQGALNRVQDEIRKAPADAELRVFLFQLLCVLGQWERALTQLNLAAELDPKALAMAQMYREAIRCELLRANVFAGRTSPMIFGEPQQWLALLIESLLTHTGGSAAHAEALRARAFDAAPASSGSIDGAPFEWLADADMRLGPVCEAVINGRYYWVPFENLARIDLEVPVDLRDLVWVPAHFQFTNGGESVGVIPSRYPGSEQAEDPHLRLARKTEWLEPSPDVFHGLGQRMLTSDAGDHPLLDVRNICFGEEVERHREELARHD